MNLRQLQYFVAVVEEGSFTRAAQRLFVAQPSLSKQVAALESELGGALIERLPRGVRLTPAGRAFLPGARATTLNAERARRAALMANDVEAGRLEIAALLSIAIGLLPRCIRALRQQHPHVLVDLHEYRHRRVMEDAVRAGVADLAIGPTPHRWDGPIVTLGWEEFVVLFPEDDPVLAQEGRVDLATLEDRRWVLPDATAGMAPLVDGVCRDAGFAPLPAVHTSQIEALARLAACGLGPTILPSNVVPGDLGHLVRQLKRPLARELSVYTRSEWPPLGQAFLQTLASSPFVAQPRNAYVYAEFADRPD
ncbi:MAG: LysR family transcriptional regulator [Mycobacterium sp.]